MSEIDHEARRRIREELDQSFIVEAAAGTGKTSELIQRVIASIAHGNARMDETVIVTFTRKASGELKLRLRQALESARRSALSPEAGQRIERAIARLEDARIGTIHGFAGDLLRERPVEAHLDPEFVALEEHESFELFRRVFSEWFERRLSDPTPGLQRALSREPMSGARDRSPMEQIADAAWQITSFRDFSAPWPRPPFDRDGALLELVDRARALVARFDEAGRPRDPLTRSIEPLRRCVDFAERAQREAALDHDVLEGFLLSAQRDLRFAKEKRGHGPFLGEGASTRGDACVLRDRLLDDLRDFAERANADLVAQLRNELYDVTLAYERKKAELGKLDFTDLLLRARALLKSHRSVRAAFQDRWSRIYVDELQDTDPLQMELLLLLAAEDPDQDDWREVRPRPGKLFLVGDPKQSIYGFRRADLALYHEVKTRLIARGVACLSLSHSFRATKPIQSFVNHCFAPLMVEDHAVGQPGYVALQGGPEGPTSQPSLIALPVPDPEGHTRQSRTRIAKALPDLVAAWVGWLIQESGFTVRSSGDPNLRQPIEARHIALLFRRYAQGHQDTTAPYLRALEARSLPHVVVGARSFYDQEEIEILRAAAIAIEWPEDELAVFATLKGPLFAIDDAVLLRYRKTVGELQPVVAVAELSTPELEPVRQALAILHVLHQQRNRRPIIETITELLEATRAHTAFAMRPAGPRVLANIYRLLDLASTFERRGGLSFRGFVERLESGTERATTVEAPVVEESAEGVRIITAHSAKGLEFPVVVLADLDTGATRRTPSRHLDPETRMAALRLMGHSPQPLLDHAGSELLREQAEDLRLAYVAGSRARDLLVIPAVESGPYPSWFGAFNRGLYPERSLFDAATPAPGCPSFATEPQMPGSGPQVRPGAHEIEGVGQVVWWDRSALKLRVPDRLGLRAQDLLRAPRSADTAARPDEASVRERWLERRSLALSLGAIPSLVPFIASATDLAPPSLGGRVEVLVVERDADRPSGPRFGTLVHNILRDVDLVHRAVDIEALAVVRGRILGATAAEVLAAARAVEHALEHPVLVAASQASYVDRELPVRLANADGTMLEGEIDLVFAEDTGALVLVDFKTDRDPSVSVEKYERQLGWYAAALQAERERALRAIILVV